MMVHRQSIKLYCKNYCDWHQKLKIFNIFKFFTGNNFKSLYILLKTIFTARTLLKNWSTFNVIMTTTIYLDTFNISLPISQIYF